MRNQTRQVPIIIENDTIRTGTATVIRLAVRQDRELVIRPRHGEVEALVVMVLVRVVARLAAALLERVALLHRGVDLVRRVAVAAAGGGAVAFEDGGGGGAEKSCQGEELRLY